MSAEHQRLAVNSMRKIPLEQWGPYLSERQWGTVREDYSPNSDAWNYLPHDQARFRAYRWGEDGIAGISDFFQNLWFYYRWMHDLSKNKPSISWRYKTSVKATHHRLGSYYFYYQPPRDCLFTENDTNFEITTGKPNLSPFTKDAFHGAIIKGEN